MSLQQPSVLVPCFLETAFLGLPAALFVALVFAGLFLAAFPFALVVLFLAMMPSFENIN
jgi:hypothetical protein